MDTQLALKWKDQIRDWAGNLGFIRMGFTGTEGVPELARALVQWEKQGFVTPFVSYSALERTEPQALWSACKTVAVVAYPLPVSRPSLAGEGKLARSAAGEDYHGLVKRQLERLTALMENAGWPGEIGPIQVDVGPLNERAFAARAGVGWIGRNHQLIVPGYGSFVALGLLLLDQVLPADAPVSPHCGECRRCETACPAQILGEFPFPGGRCLSYLTQSKEPLSSAQAQQLGTRIFGCDTCQEACPHNQRRLQWERTARAEAAQGVDLMEILCLTRSGFQARFAATAAGWRGKGLLRRNALIALVNSRDGRLSPWLRSKEGKKASGFSPLLRPYLPENE